MDEAVDGLPPVSLPVSGQVAKQWKRQAPRFVALRAQLTPDLRCLLELTVAAEHDAVQENLGRDVPKKVFKERHLEFACMKGHMWNTFMLTMSELSDIILIHPLSYARTVNQTLSQMHILDIKTNSC